MTPFDQVAARFGFTDTHPALRESWPASEALRESGRSGFFQPEQLEETARLLGMPDDFIRDLLAALPVAKADRLLYGYLCHCRRLLSDPAAGWPSSGAGFPVISPESSPAAGMGYALVFLDRVPEALRLIRERGIPDAITADTFSDFRRWAEAYKQKHGSWGLSNLGWLQMHLRAMIFALGRLQFKTENYHYDYHAWRQKTTGRLLVLAGEGMTFQSSGLLALGEGAIPSDSDAWRTEYREGESEVSGSPVDPRGWAVRPPVRLSRREWEPVLKKGDPTLGIHIPAGGTMDFDACGESLARAPAFFAQYFPRHAVKALTCSSWFLDPQLDGRLPETSNIIRFMREMYLHPLPGTSDYAIFERVFNCRRPSADASVEGMTTLQRAILDFVRAGGAWRAGSSLLLPGDLRWGTHVYRKMWPAGI